MKINGLNVLVCAVRVLHGGRGRAVCAHDGPARQGDAPGRLGGLPALRKDLFPALQPARAPPVARRCVTSIFQNNF